MSSDKNRNSFNDAKYSIGRAKKRKRGFQGRPRYSSDNDDPFPRPSSASSSKISDDEYLETDEQGYMLFDLRILFQTLESNLSCNRCSGAIRIREVRIHGLGGSYEIQCRNCPFSSKFNNCRMIGKKNNVFELNRRSILASRCVGQGSVGLVQVAANIAAITFSEGQRGILEVMKELSIEPRRHALAAAKLQDLNRITAANRRAQQRTKEARVAPRQLHMNQQEEAVDTEGTSYERGAF